MLAAENPDSTVDELEYLKGVQGDSGAQGSLTYAQVRPFHTLTSQHTDT